MRRREELNYRERSRRARRARARYVDRCRAIVACALGMIVASVICGAGVLRSNASSSEDPMSYKYYKSIVIACDYSLRDAAADYADEHYNDEDDYLQEVCSINHISSMSDVTPGTCVVIPYYAEEFR